MPTAPLILRDGGMTRLPTVLSRNSNSLTHRLRRRHEAFVWVLFFFFFLQSGCLKMWAVSILCLSVTHMSVGVFSTNSEFIYITTDVFFFSAYYESWDVDIKTFAIVFVFT